MEYDHSEWVKAKIEPFIKELKKVCYAKQIPFFFTIAQRNMDGKTDYYSEMLSGVEEEIGLHNNVITQCAMVTNGMKTTVAPLTEEDFKNGKA